LTINTIFEFKNIELSNYCRINWFSTNEIGMIYEYYFLILVYTLVAIGRYLIYLAKPKDTKVLAERRLEMIAGFKWTGLFSLGGFLILSVIAAIYAVVGESFYTIFKYYDEEDGVQSDFFIYRSMFFIGIATVVIFFFFGGKPTHLISGKYIDQDLRQEE
jgi:hypothetical protein